MLLAMAVGARDTTNDALASENEALKAALAKLERENARLSDELTILLNKLFRQKSERLDASQLRLFTEQLTTAEDEAPAPPKDPPAPKTARKGHGRAPFAEDAPRVVIDVDLPASERTCEQCGKALVVFGEDTCERGHIVPARIVVRRYVRKKYGCPAGHCVRTAELPPSVIDKGKYEASVYAHLAVAKYGDHVPLNRLEGIYKRNGLYLRRSSMWEMLARIDEIAAGPILRQMCQELREEPVLHADETPTTVVLEDRKGSKKAYIWCYGAGAKWVFDFTMTRERDGPRSFLRGWKGALLTDGYSGYDEAVRENGIARAGCWAHARRKLMEALDTGASQAVPLMRAVQRLFWIERAVKRRVEARCLDDASSLELRGHARARMSSRVLKRIRQLITELWEERSTLPKSLLGKALGYIDNQWEPLTCFLGDASLPIHNNDAERALRHVVVGRKNWLFFGSPRGARVGANLFSLIATCKALGVNPEAYIEDVLVRVDTTPASEIARLTPWAWAAEQAAASSD